MIWLTILGTNYEVPHYGAFSTPYSYSSRAQTLTSGPYFQIPLDCIPPMLHQYIAELAILLFHILVF